MRMRVLVLGAAALLLSPIAEAAPDGATDSLRAAIRKLSESGSYAWNVSIQNSGEATERYSVGPLDGKIEKSGYTWIRTRETPAIEIILKGQKMAVRMDEGWGLEQDLASGTRFRGHANLSLIRSVKNHPRPVAQANSLLKYAKGLSEDQPGYFTSPVDDAGAKELLRQTLHTTHTPEITAQKASLAFWVRDGILARYEITLRGTVSYPAPAASTWNADLRVSVDITGVGTTAIDIPDEARTKLEER